MAASVGEIKLKLSGCKMRQFFCRCNYVPLLIFECANFSCAFDRSSEMRARIPSLATLDTGGDDAIKMPSMRTRAQRERHSMASMMRRENAVCSRLCARKREKQSRARAPKRVLLALRDEHRLLCSPSPNQLFACANLTVQRRCRRTDRM